MAFYSREYEVYVVLGGPNASPPWVYSTWREASGAVDPLIEAARGRPAVRSTQLGPKSGSPNQRSISFGRVGWNDKGARKWCHSEDGQLVSSDPSRFLGSEVWAPSWTACERDRLAPDVYFAMSKAFSFDASGKPNDALNFNSTCVLAVATDMGPSAVGQARRSAESVASVLHAALRAHSVRPWGRPFGPGSYSNAINDLVTVGLFKPGPRHKEPVSLSMLDGSWASF
ncbi:MAG: hypothetical protein ACLPSW_19275 [Roseiarcus sp.]